MAEILATALVLFVALSLLLRRAARRGLQVVWLLLLLGWIVALSDAHWSVPEAVRLLPESFLAWSMFAVPVHLAGAFVQRGEGARAGALAAALIASTLGAALLARYAPDVPMSPRDLPAVGWLVAIALPATAVVPCLYWLRLLRETRSRNVP